MRLMDVQRREAWISEPKCISRRAWNLGRYRLATSNRALLDSEQQPWVVLPDERSHVFETQPDEGFFEQLQKHPVPMEEAAVKHIFAFLNSVVANARGETR